MRQGKLWQSYQWALNHPDLERPSPYLTILRDEPSGTLFWWYAAPDDADPEDEQALRGCNPAPWLALDQLRSLHRRPDLSPNEYRRLILNQWPQARRRRRSIAGRG